MIQIAGMSPSASEVDFSQECGGLPWGSQAYSLWFEMHDRSLWERRGDVYLQTLKDSCVPIYMQRVEPDIPMSREYPLDRVASVTGDYFNSSIAYMLALAVYENRDIRLYGVDNHTDEEWWFERPCNEYLIGLAKGRGLDVWVHPDSSLLKFQPTVRFGDEVQNYRGRYGYL